MKLEEGKMYVYADGEMGKLVHYCDKLQEWTSLKFEADGSSSGIMRFHNKDGKSSDCNHNIVSEHIEPIEFWVNLYLRKEGIVGIADYAFEKEDLKYLQSETGKYLRTSLFREVI